MSAAFLGQISESDSGAHVCVGLPPGQLVDRVYPTDGPFPVLRRPVDLLLEDLW